MLRSCSSNSTQLVLRQLARHQQEAGLHWSSNFEPAECAQAACTSPEPSCTTQAAQQIQMCRWAWYPVDRLQLEVSATTGQTMAPSAVAEAMGVCYATLEQVAPQFPSRFS